MGQINRSIDFKAVSERQQKMRDKLSIEYGAIAEHITMQFTKLITGTADELCAKYAVAWCPELAKYPAEKLGKEAAKKNMGLVAQKTDDFGPWKHLYYAYCPPSRKVRCARISYRIDPEQQTGKLGLIVTHEEVETFNEELDNAIRKVFKL